MQEATTDYYMLLNIKEKLNELFLGSRQQIAVIYYL